MTTIYQPFVTYNGDGATTRFTFNFPYLSRAHVMVTRDEAAALFTWIDDSTLDIHTLFGEPLPQDEVIKIFRQTPDLDAFAVFTDASLMTAADLNRARLQVLYLIQERSGGIAGSVSTVVSSLTNEIETLSGALDSLSYSQGLLTAGLQTIDDLSTRLTSLGDDQATLQALINQKVTDFDATTGTLTTRVDNVETRQGNLETGVSQQIATLVNQDSAFASRIDTVEAKINSIDLGGDGGGDDGSDDIIAASIITTAIAEAKSHYSQATQLETLKAQIGEAAALVQTEQTARVDADGLLAEQITALQTQIGDNLSQIIETMQSSIDTVDGKVTALNAQYTLKAQVQRADGKPIMASIGLAATANNDMSGSEIVLMSDRLVFADPNAPEGTLRPLFVAGNVDGSPTFIIPSNSMGDRTYPGRLLVDGSIEGRSVAANTITGDKIKAGSIDTDKLTVGLGANLLNASEFVEKVTASTAKGWAFSYTADAGIPVAFYDMASFTLLGGHTIGMYTTQAGNGATIDSSNSYFYSDAIPISTGTFYEFSVYAGAIRGAVDIGVFWYNKDSTYVGQSGFQALAGTKLAPNTWVGGVSLTDYARIGGIAQAPATATLARVLMRKGSMFAPDTSSYAFFTKPFFAETSSQATRLSPYTVGGLQTIITPGGISTPSLSALSANIGFLMSGTPGGARTEMDGFAIRVYDSNNVMRVRMGIW